MSWCGYNTDKYVYSTISAVSPFTVDPITWLLLVKTKIITLARQSKRSNIAQL